VVGEKREEGEGGKSQRQASLGKEEGADEEGSRDFRSLQPITFTPRFDMMPCHVPFFVPPQGCCLTSASTARCKKLDLKQRQFPVNHKV
jgi:hypothetical protein